MWLTRYYLVISGKYETEFDFDEIHFKRDNVTNAIISAFESNKYVESAKIGEISFSRGTTMPFFNLTARAGRSHHAESEFAVVDFTLNCILNTTSTSDDIESSIKNSFSDAMNATNTELFVEKVILISETKKILIEEHLSKTEDKRFFFTPNQTEFDDIMTDENDDNCRGSNQWTEWYSQV